VDICHQGVDSLSLRTKALALLDEAISVDAAYFATTDPTTLLHTSGVVETSRMLSGLSAEQTSRFIHNELAEPDVNKFLTLARARVPVSSLTQATEGDLFRSSRYADLLRPIGLGDELRAALRTRNDCWGFLCLHRADPARPYSSTEVAFLARLAPHLAEGLRRSAVAQAAATISTDDGPGVLVIDDGSVVATNDAATRWLAELAESDLPRSGALPVAVAAVIARLRAVTRSKAAEGVTPRLTTRTAAGRWLVLHASQLISQNDGHRQISIVIEPVGPAHSADTIAAAYRFTPRESQIAVRLLHGLPIAAIAAECRISEHTVRDHCKAIFEKVGVNSRGEFMALAYRR